MLAPGPNAADDMATNAQSAADGALALNAAIETARPSAHERRLRRCIDLPEVIGRHLGRESYLSPCVVSGALRSPAIALLRKRDGREAEKLVK